MKNYYVRFLTKTGEQVPAVRVLVDANLNESTAKHQIIDSITEALDAVRDSLGATNALDSSHPFNQLVRMAMSRAFGSNWGFADSEDEASNCIYFQLENIPEDYIEKQMYVEKGEEKPFLTFYTNSCGDVFDIDEVTKPTKLPIPLQRIYYRFYSEDNCGLANYCVKNDETGEYGLLLSCEFLPQECESLRGVEFVDAMTACLDAQVKVEAQNLAKLLNRFHPEVTVYVVPFGGMDNCHEMHTFIPESMKDADIEHVLYIVGEFVHQFKINDDGSTTDVQVEARVPKAYRNEYLKSADGSAIQFKFNGCATKTFYVRALTKDKDLPTVKLVFDEDEITLNDVIYALSEAENEIRGAEGAEALTADDLLRNMLNGAFYGHWMYEEPTDECAMVGSYYIADKILKPESEVIAIISKALVSSAPFDILSEHPTAVKVKNLKTGDVYYITIQKEEDNG